MRTHAHSPQWVAHVARSCRDVGWLLVGHVRERCVARRHWKTPRNSTVLFQTPSVTPTWDLGISTYMTSTCCQLCEHHGGLDTCYIYIFIQHQVGSTVDIRRLNKIYNYSATYMSQTRDQQRFTISNIAADWHAQMVPQCIVWPSIARANGQLDPRCR